MAAHKFDRKKESPIVKQLHKETPPDGASNAIRGLTDHADETSMAAESNSNVGLSSRQLLSPAVDGFFVGQIEYCEPPQEVLDDFARAVLSRLSVSDDGNGLDVATYQSFRQFLGVVVTMMTKEANREQQ